MIVGIGGSVICALAGVASSANAINVARTNTADAGTPSSGASIRGDVHVLTHCHRSAGYAYAGAPLLAAMPAISSVTRSNSSSESTGVPSKGRSRVISSHERQPW